MAPLSKEELATDGVALETAAEQPSRSEEGPGGEDEPRGRP